MDIIYEIHRRYSVQKKTITAIARDMGISRPIVRKHLNTVEEPKYERLQPASPKLGQFAEQLIRWRLKLTGRGATLVLRPRESYG